MRTSPDRTTLTRRSKLGSPWARHRTVLLGLSIVSMAGLMAVRWKLEVHRLLFDDGPKGAIDLATRFHEVSYWFAGQPVYGQLGNAAPSPYPPASYVMLWPLLGWLDLTAARWLWAATMLVALVSLIAIIVHEIGADTLLERSFLILLVPSMYSTCITIGNGQLGLHVLAMVVGGLLLLGGDEGDWPTDLLASLLILFSLVKPSIAAPFFWIVLRNRRGLRPAALVTVMYVLLTVLAASFRQEGPLALMRMWVSASRDTALNARYGYANLHQWMNGLELGKWTALASLMLLVSLGMWIWRERERDPWLLMGVTAIIARVWTYHALYDDVLLLIPMVALLRMARLGASGGGVGPVLLLVCWASLLAPARMLTLPPPWDLLFRAGQAAVWGFVLVFLVVNRSWTPREVSGESRPG